MRQTAVEWLIEAIESQKITIVYSDKILSVSVPIDIADQAKEMEKEQMNNLPIVIHEGIENTWAYIKDGVIHILPNYKPL